MKIILLEDIKNLGKKHDIKKVPDGFARNYLIPHGIVKIATKENLESLKIKQEKEKKRVEEELKKTGEMASEMDGQEIEIKIKVGEDNQFFEKISEQKIAKKLRELGFDIDKSQIEFLQPIEELGEFPVKIKFKDNLEVEIKVIVSVSENEPQGEV